MTKHIPNAVTLANLASGCLGVVFCLEGRYEWVMILIGFSMIADFADGLLARALKANSPLGIQLDSLADAVSFGVLPGAILYVLIGEAAGDTGSGLLRLPHLGFLFSVFAAYRLGKFNIDTRQSQHFLGMATPAATLFVLGLLMTWHFKAPVLGWLLGSPVALIAATGVLCALMVSEIPMFSFKLKGLRFKGNEAQVVFLVLSLPLALYFKWAALPFIMALYVAVSLVYGALLRRTGR